MNDAMTEEQLSSLEEHALASTHDIGGGVVLRLITEIRLTRAQLLGSEERMTRAIEDLHDTEAALDEALDERDRFESEIYDLEGELESLDKKLTSIRELLK